ncbi:pregnancy-specific beta-1-glycoprotein 3-like isoform X2 [Pseudophryne corroboree]|uniref:pregnancy-specific beta-1-glycoprotein 3-like isoform X2 n=1 Tax=Pseudophryne corroboree TaxID=495146 RepID=UPI003081D2BD
MWSLCVPLLCVLMPLGQGESPGDQRDIIIARLGSNVTLSMRHTVTINHQGTQKCDVFDWRYRDVTARTGSYSSAQYRLADNIRCTLNIGNGTSFHNYNVSEDGNLTLYNVTRENAGDYTVTVTTRSTGATIITANYTLHVQAPLSQAAANFSCFPDGSAKASCWVGEGSDPDYSWSLDGRSVQGRSISGYSQISLPPPVSVTLRCNVRNKISDTNTSVVISCPVPLSQVAANFSCLQDGSAEASCWVGEGSDPDYSWSLDGRSVQRMSISRYSQISLPPPVSGTLRCNVSNKISNNSTSVIIFCPVPLSVPIVNASCAMDGSASLSCLVENGMNASYRWTVGGNSSHGNKTDITVSARHFIPGAINVSCSVTNSVSEETSNQTQIFCPAPVSDPVLNVSCLQNGLAVISCWVLSGTDPSFSLTVNGQLVAVNASSRWAGVNYTVPIGGPWNVSCSVINQLGGSVTDPSVYTCLGSRCYTCLEKSVMWGTVVLIVTTAPLIIATFYTVYSTKGTP